MGYDSMLFRAFINLKRISLFVHLGMRITKNGEDTVQYSLLHFQICLCKYMQVKTNEEGILAVVSLVQRPYQLAVTN